GPSGARRTAGKAVLDDEVVDRSDDEHRGRVTIDAVGHFLEPRQGAVLVDRIREDVADAAPLQVAGPGVMHGMRPAEVIVRRQCQYAQYSTGPVIAGLARKKGTVAAI